MTERLSALLYQGTSVCDGDSGGGMFFYRDGHYYIRGITSVAVTLKQSSIRQCDPSQYFIFTDIAYFYDWIFDRMVGRYSHIINPK